jgi:hypothetical protein
MVASSSKKAMQMNLKHGAKPTQASISQSKKAARPSALSTQSAPGSSRHASVEEIEDKEEMHVGGTLGRDSDIIMELSNDEAERSRISSQVDPSNNKDMAVDDEEVELSW